MGESGIWGYGQGVGHREGIDLTGYKVEATDGAIGKIDKHSEDVGASHLVVDTGVWIFGKHVLLPAGTIRLIDTVEEKVYVDRTKEQIKNAPEFDRAKYAGESDYLEQFARYYGQPHM
ncbi:PRC-barrel domain containing protein [Streptomyces sp. NBC_00249]|uniref:PRC-barrel domain containing protein n=1 Tax=Streptomyces sp. NBC_00249 TaxID=2975690 RepID=UPI0022553005|nr:PRC-barrel domain containing protein [Streptomyces sp. NBC_00249]MCX5192820.1 PRC-barrel domain containing protein [Streptomyces sp. NBC_00249]